MQQQEFFSQGQSHIGTDESGKGDYFGPLVVGGVFLPQEQHKVLKELGVKDSKKFSDKRVREIARLIRKGFSYSIVAIGPEKYNELYGKLRNLNKVLAWAHSRAIENLLEKVICEQAVTDQFGDKFYVQNALMKRGKTIQLVQKHRGEQDMAVAAASILARAEFLRRLYFLSQNVGLDLPKGSSPHTEETGVRLVMSHGSQVLNRVAKTHFKLTSRIFEVVRSKTQRER
ncbi:ribonuclease HIII [bacterium]|nr:ribonuclease HIII [bacterium]